MSNVIKAYNIRYSEEKKKVDMNQKAEQFQRAYFESLPVMEEVEQPLNDDIQEAYFASSGENTTQEQTQEKLEEEREEAQKQIEESRLAAEEECRLVISNAKKQAEQIIADAKRKADEERAKILLDARNDGYQTGKKLAVSELATERENVEKQKAAYDEEYKRKIDEMEPAFTELVIKLIKKITGILVEDRRDLILHVIRQSMEDIENSNNFIIRVSKADFDFVNSKKNELMYELRGTTIEIVEDPILQRAQCTIETDTRILDCSLDVQLKNLIADLSLLSEGPTEDIAE